MNLTVTGMIAYNLDMGTLFALIDKTTSELIRCVSAFNDIEINAMPGAGSWTAAQVADHVTRSNVLIARTLKKDGRPCDREPDAFVDQLRAQFLDFSTRLQSPESILPTRDIYPKDVVLADLEISVEQLNIAIKHTHLSELINVPLFGEVTKFELVHFVVHHTQRHIHQLKNIFNTITTSALCKKRKLISLMHMSLDGFVAGNNGEMNWIIMDEEIFRDSIDITSSADTAVYGRTSYSMMESYWPTVLSNPTSSGLELQHAKWLEKTKKIVFSTTMEKVHWNNTMLIRQNIEEELKEFKRQPGANMVIFGSPGLTHSLMQQGLVDEYRININPVVLGGGIPFFRNLQSASNLRLLSTKKFRSGVVGVHYEVMRPET